MAQAMGLVESGDVAGAIREMNARLGLPSGLSSMGVKANASDKIITGAMADHCHKTNPRLATISDYAELLEQSM